MTAAGQSRASTVRRTSSSDRVPVAPLSPTCPHPALRLGGPGHRHEQRRHERGVDQPAVALLEEVQDLLVLLAERHDEPAPLRELIDERLRHPLRGAGDDDPVERRVLGPAEEPVADPRVDALGAEPAEGRGGRLAERRDDLDRVDLGPERREHRRLVPAARADFEDPVRRPWLERLRHGGDDERRRDGLPVADVERLVEIGRAEVLRLHEQVARHLPHRVEDARVGDALAGEILVHHPAAARGERVRLDGSRTSRQRRHDRAGPDEPSARPGSRRHGRTLR